MMRSVYSLSFILLCARIIFAMDEIEIASLELQSPFPVTSTISIGEETLNTALDRPRQIIIERENTIGLAEEDPSQYVKRWLDVEIVNKKESLNEYANKALLTFGYLSAFARGSVYFILAYKLSESIFVPTVPGPGNYIISALYATASSVPMTLLGAGSSHKFLKYLLTPTSQNFINIKNEESGVDRATRIIKNTIFLGAAACSASILTYIAYDNFYELIGWFWLVPGTPTFYVRTLIDFYAVTQLSDAAYNKIVSEPKNKKLYVQQPESREAHLFAIEQMLLKSKNFIGALNYQQAKILENIVKDPGTDASLKIKAFTKPEFYIEEEVNIIKTSFFRELIGYIGGAIAICGMYLYYNDTKAAFEFMQPFFKLTAAETNNAEISLATISLATASSLSAIAAYSSSLKFYDLSSLVLKKISSCVDRDKRNFSNLAIPMQTREDRQLIKKRAAIAAIAILLAACDAGTLYQVAVQQSLSMQDAENVLALTASSVALFSMSFWAVDEALINYLRGGDPKATILGIIDQINSSLSSLSNWALRDLRRIFEAENVMQNETHSPLI